MSVHLEARGGLDVAHEPSPAGGRPHRNEHAVFIERIGQRLRDGVHAPVERECGRILPAVGRRRGRHPSRRWRSGRPAPRAACGPLPPASDNARRDTTSRASCARMAVCVARPCTDFERPMRRADVQRLHHRARRARARASSGRRQSAARCRARRDRRTGAARSFRAARLSSARRTATSEMPRARNPSRKAMRACARAGSCRRPP